MKKNMKIGLFIPCYVNQLYPNAAIATLELLQKFGAEVSYPSKQTCCGQPMANSGYEHLTQSCNDLFIHMLMKMQLQRLEAKFLS